MVRRSAVWECLGVVLVVVFSLSAQAKGTLSKHVTTWKGLTRYYAIYRPKTLAASPSLVLFLNATSENDADDPPYFFTPLWQKLADQYGFVIAWPISSYNPTYKDWYWDCYETDSTFAVAPDDTGFLRWLITSLQSQYRISSAQTYVTGMSSGAFMAHRAGTDLSDIVAAVAPVSGMIDIHPIGQNFDPPQPAFPVSVYELHGDEDTEVPYCGGTGWYWGKLHDQQPSIDDSVSFWVSADSCAKRSTTKPLCTDGQPTEINFEMATSCSGGAAVIFEREPGVGHVWVDGTESKGWNFFRSHPRK
ncbi:MAG TPA: PHB depolymerase family esterase [Candidatus Sulfotelmatobacter sp.]